MTVVRYDKKHRTLTCEGHAEYAEKGKDIVCASISATMRMVTTSAYLSGGDVSLKEGYVRVKVGKKAKEAAAVMDTAFICLEALALEYPENVRAFHS